MTDRTKVKVVASNTDVEPLEARGNTTVVSTATTEDDQDIWGQLTGSVAGGFGGAWAGAATGAAVGSVIPVVGTAIGGIVGGLAGAALGSGVGGTAGNAVENLIEGDEITWDDSKEVFTENAITGLVGAGGVGAATKGLSVVAKSGLFNVLKDKVMGTAYNRIIGTFGGNAAQAGSFNRAFYEGMLPRAELLKKFPELNNKAGKLHLDKLLKGRKTGPNNRVLTGEDLWTKAVGPELAAKAASDKVARPGVEALFSGSGAGVAQSVAATGRAGNTHQVERVDADFGNPGKQFPHQFQNYKKRLLKRKNGTTLDLPKVEKDGSITYQTWKNDDGKMVRIK